MKHNLKASCVKYVKVGHFKYACLIYCYYCNSSCKSVKDNFFVRIEIKSYSNDC